MRRPRSKTSYYSWIGVFFVMIFSMIALLYFATERIEYIWHWEKMLGTFYYYDHEEVDSELEGDVTDIQTDNDKVIITVREKSGHKETYTVTADDIRVTEGDYVYPGDVLATFGKWKPGIMLQGLWLTLKISFFAIILGIFIGLVGGLARISDNPMFKWMAITYVEIIRGSPLLVQIYIWYFVLGTMTNQLLGAYGLREIPSIWFGIASLACFTGAYVTEIVRGGIQAIPRGQMEAARSLGMSYAGAMGHVILPQAFRQILPPLAGQFISLIKDSSLLGIIAIRELTKAAREVNASTLSPFEVFFTLAALYLVMTFALSLFVQYLERRTATK